MGNRAMKSEVNSNQAPGQAVAVADGSLETMIRTWLHAKRNHSDSAATEERYGEYLRSFRALLWQHGIDLNGDPASVATLAQGWAARTSTSTRVAAATFNLRLAALSSFYHYAIRKGQLRGDNPIDRVDRRHIQPYANARALSHSQVSERLAAIDLETLHGQRDYALLMLTLTTGRRLSEVAGMERQHLTLDGNHIVVTFPHAKGGKVMRDALEPGVAAVLVLYLRTLDAEMPHHQPGAVWVSVSKHMPGHMLHKRSLEHICLQRFGTTRFHALRHTFAHSMEDIGAKISEISARLGHSNVAITGTYLTSMRSEQNPYASALAALFRDAE